MSEDFVKVSKQEYAVNVIGLGYAIEMLSKISHFSTIIWASEIAIEANKRCDELSDEEVDQLIANHQPDETGNRNHTISKLKIGDN